MIERIFDDMAVQSALFIDIEVGNVITRIVLFVYVIDGILNVISKDVAAEFIVLFWFKDRE